MTPSSRRIYNQRHRIINNSNRMQYLLISTLLATQIASVFCHGIEGESTLTPAFASNPNHRIRGASEKKQQRMHPIHRIYGPENASVRAEMHKLETESNQYWKTGIRVDPTFEVPYKNHPFAHNRHQHQHQRQLNEDDIVSPAAAAEGDSENFMQPMRIHWDPTALNSMANDGNSAKIEFIKTYILPQMSQFWSEALAVVPVSDNLKIQRNELINGYCGDSEFSAVPESHLNTGVPDTDLILYISGTPSTRFCGPSTLAVAVACNWDQYDRPTAGAINFCIDQIQLDADGTAHPAIIDDNLVVATHEAGHVLGMSSNSYRYFWDPVTAEPRTARPIKATSVTCVDGTTKNTYVPDENTLQFIKNDQGVIAATIVTEKVRTVARNQFNCADLEGAQLENQPTGSSCTGDHWDERLFYPESLSGVVSPTTNVLSPLTLALMEDSGWYAANYSKANVSPWGHGVGCDFARKPCLELGTDGETTVPDYSRGYFCTKASDRGCSPTHNYKMACFFRDYGLSSTSQAPPAHFQYFSNPSLGGLKTADYCPIFGDNYKSSVHDLDCRDPANGDGIDWQGLGEKYGSNSTCFESSRGEGLCYTSKCVRDEFKLHVQMQGLWFTCESDFQEIEIPTTVASVLGRKITCPRLSSVCPDMFCPANCAGRGVCNFEAIVDGVQRPKCECFDTSDNSEGCTTSLTLDGRYIEDSSGLFNVNIKGFFDDLIAVFTDQPETWNTASWCWASGLFGLFLILVLCICSTFWPKRRPKRSEYNRAPRRGDGNTRRPRGRKDSSTY